MLTNEEMPAFMRKLARESIKQAVRQTPPADRPKLFKQLQDAIIREAKQEEKEAW